VTLLDSVALYTLILSNVGWEGELAWGDVEPDGDLDLAVGSYDDPYSAELRVLESSGGALLPVTTIPIYAYFSAFDWLDLDGDGDLELAADSTCEDDADQRGDRAAVRQRLPHRRGHGGGRPRRRRARRPRAGHGRLQRRLLP
jgi:hypothetical protein